MIFLGTICQGGCGKKVGGIFGLKNFGDSQEPMCQDCYEQKSEAQSSDSETQSNYTDMGRPIFSREKAIDYWMQRNSQGFDIDTGEPFDSEPVIHYEFKKEEQAKEALLNINCIDKNQKLGKLICREDLIYGYYKNESIFEAMIAGHNLTKSVYNEAKKSFEKNGGKKKTLLPPK